VFILDDTNTLEVKASVLRCYQNQAGVGNHGDMKIAQSGLFSKM